MKWYKKHISVFLLLALTWVLLPGAFVHELFANHKDTVCEHDHSSDESNFESPHTHCDIFKTNSPIYDVPKLVSCVNPIQIIVAELRFKVQVSYFHLAQLKLPTRAPPEI